MPAQELAPRQSAEADTRARVALGGRKAIFLVLGNVLVSLLVPYLINRVTDKAFDFQSEVTIALLVAIVMTIIEILYFVSVAHDQKATELRLWAATSEVDQVLGEVRYSLHELIREEGIDGNLFLDYYRAEIAALANKVRNTLNRNEIMLDRFHVNTTDALLRGFSGRQVDMFRANNLLWDVTALFDATYKEYVYAIEKSLNEGRLVEVRRLFLTRDGPAEIQKPEAKKWLAYHNSVERLHGKILKYDDYKRLKLDFNLADSSDDFGIYGDKYLYIGQVRELGIVAGHFSRDQDFIARYTRFFDTCWSVRSAQNITTVVSETVTADELFDTNFTL